jgi:hypothetical protein
MHFCTELHELSKEFDIETPAMDPDLVCAFVGEWNSGKSTLINNLVGVQLPTKPISTTKTVVLLRKVESNENVRAVLETEDGSITEELGVAAGELLQRSIENLKKIEYLSPSLNMPPATAFVDTPGFNDEDQSANTKAESVNADIIIFVFQGAGSAINQTQMAFINNVLLTKGDIKDLFFVVSHTDLLSKKDTNEIRDRYQKTLGKTLADRLYFVDKSSESSDEFRKNLFDYIQQRRLVLVENRREKLQKNLLMELENKVLTEQAVLKQLKGQRKEDVVKMGEKLSQARKKEQQHRQGIREKNRQRLFDITQTLRETVQDADSTIEDLIENSTVEELRNSKSLNSIIEQIIEEKIKPVAENKLHEFEKDMQKDIKEAHSYSTDLTLNLEIKLPAYNAPMSNFLTGESFLTAATLGAITFGGFFSVTTILLGYLTIKAKDLGLTRAADRTGTLDNLLDKAKEKVAEGHKRMIIMSVSKELTNYLNQVSDQYRTVVENATEEALQHVNIIENIDKAYKQLTGSTDLSEKELSLESAMSTIATCKKLTSKSFS